jgi:hypothetical protein
MYLEKGSFSVSATYRTENLNSSFHITKCGMRSSGLDPVATLVNRVVNLRVP